MRPRPLAVLIVAVGIATSMSGCGSGAAAGGASFSRSTCVEKYGEPQSVVRRNVVVVIDQSTRFTKEFIDRERVKLVGQLQIGDQVTVVSFAGAEDGGLSVERFHAVWPGTWRTTEGDIRQAVQGKRSCSEADEAGYKAKVGGVVGAALGAYNDNQLGRSNILYELKKTVSSVGPSVPLLLAIYSDGMEHGGAGGISFYGQNGTIRPFDPAAELEVAKRMGLVPQLIQAELMWFGLGLVSAQQADAPSARDTADLLRLQHFWRAWAREAGGSSFNGERL